MIRISCNLSEIKNTKQYKYNALMLVLAWVCRERAHRTYSLGGRSRIFLFGESFTLVSIVRGEAML